MDRSPFVNKIAPLLVGLAVFVSTLVAWLYAETHAIDSGPLFYIASPVIGALFFVPSLNRAADASTQAAHNTNGVLDERIQNSVAKALANRDAARALTSGTITTTPYIATHGSAKS